MPGSDKSHGRQEEQVELDTVKAVQAYGSGVRTTLRMNGTAYGYSVSITCAFGLVATAQGQASFPTRVLLFALGAAAAFTLVGALASRLFRRSPASEGGGVALIEGAVDVLSILGAIGAAAGLSRIPGLGAWAATAFGTTFVYLLVGGLDVLLARQMARRAKSA